jgi:hypothetical protein
MSKTRYAEELAAPLGSVDVAHLAFARGTAHLTIRVDGSMQGTSIGRGSRGRCPTSGSTEASWWSRTS